MIIHIDSYKTKINKYFAMNKVEYVALKKSDLAGKRQK